MTANHLRYFIKTLNILSEGMHLVEHLLLRPAAGSKGFADIPDDFSFLRASVVLPTWPARCTNAGFRRLAEETIRLNGPAHIAIDFYWLGFQQMLAFEILYHDWLEKKRADNGPDTQMLAQKLIRFFMDHASRASRNSFL